MFGSVILLLVYVALVGERCRHAAARTPYVTACGVSVGNQCRGPLSNPLLEPFADGQCICQRNADVGQSLARLDAYGKTRYVLLIFDPFVFYLYDRVFVKCRKHVWVLCEEYTRGLDVERKLLLVVVGHITDTLVLKTLFGGEDIRVRQIYVDDIERIVSLDRHPLGIAWQYLSKCVGILLQANPYRMRRCVLLPFLQVVTRNLALVVAYDNLTVFVHCLYGVFV